MSFKSAAQVLMAASAAVVAFGVLFYLENKEYQDNKAYIEMCEIMGGVAVIGRYGTNQCFNQAALLAAE